MTAKNDGGPAFPVYDDHGQYVNGGGMTLRDYFAAKAMHQFLARSVLPPEFDASELFLMVAARAYEMADAMLKARETP
mgnify:FL=1